MKIVKLYTIKAYNQHGGTYHVAATGSNLAKAALRESVNWAKKLEVVGVDHNLIVADNDKI